MIFGEILLAFAIALVFALGFEAMFKRPGPWGSSWAFILTTFLLILAVGAWMQPFGPLAFGIAWAPFLLAGIFLMLLFAAIPARPMEVEVVEPRTSESAATGLALGFGFWLFVILLAVASGAAYLSEWAEFV